MAAHTRAFEGWQRRGDKASVTHRLWGPTPSLHQRPAHAPPTANVSYELKLCLCRLESVPQLIEDWERELCERRRA